MPCAALKAADLELKAACQDALEELTLSAMSLSEDLPHRWAKLLSGSRVYMQGGGDCECSPMIPTGTLRLTMETDDGS
jgi:hypothetical protein